METPPRYLPALETKVGSQTFTCAGDGLMKNGHAFCSDIDRFLPLLEPKRTKAGKIAVRQPHVPKQPMEWWRAQCAFRALPQSGKMADLQDRLRRYNGSMDDELQQMQRRLNTEYWKRNAAAREEKWLALRSNEARAEMDLNRFLREQFLDVTDDASKDKVIILKTCAGAELRSVVEAMGLEHDSTSAPLNADHSYQDPRQWLVVGKSRSAVFRKVSEISREAQRSQQRAKEALREDASGLRKAIVSKLTASEKSGMWNVVGSWSIQAPCIQGHTGDDTEKCTLNIYLSDSSRGRQIFGVFDFIIVTGIMRFINPHPSQVLEKTSGRSVRKEIEDEEDEKDEDEDEDDEESSDEFYMDNNIMPSSSNPTWKYRWRGEETGEHETQLGSDEKIYSITFKGEGGTELEGEFNTGICCEGCQIFGTKTSRNPSSRMPDPSEEWRSRNEEAYEYARVARWH